MKSFTFFVQAAAAALLLLSVALAEELNLRGAVQGAIQDHVGIGANSKSNWVPDRF